MLAVVFVLSVLFVGCVTVPKFGSRQADNQVKVLEREISLIQNEIFDLETEIKDSTISFQEKAVLNKKISAKQERLEALRENRNNIIYAYTTDDEVPTEISSHERDQRKNSFQVRRQEMVLSKVSDYINGVAISSDAVVSRNGYKVLLINDYYLTVSFVIKGLDGGDDISVTLSPRTKDSVYLLPGRYYASCLDGNRPLGSKELNVDGSRHSYKGELCFESVRVSR
ncbi:hypothetical protein COT93_03385 [Candidatus Falkowbacteria bacterium CG10_big_fil_rev_8_21_14_0_10_37_18]|uniref:Uncharacterized protein n=1 Tax=Candidatus Falkowbacteria bacterium CG10_big_fil_rev_8_21_14_0_10_37_18 TaxID=1974562 RepID=A0A2H0VA73_9BACT|nr:MAG: hypothetical protein COT93_03385 [Candidatus Falkowbacteria bacterium CG10_big_fil_rev_8_21_14_0_10_37_18]